MLTSALVVVLTLGPSTAPEARTDDALAFVGRVEVAEATIEARHSTLTVEASGPVISGRFELEMWLRKPSSVVAIVTAATDARYAGARFQLLDDELTVQDTSGTYRRRMPDDLRLLAPLMAANFVPLLRDSAPRLVSGAAAVRELSLERLPGLSRSLAAARVWIDGTTLEPLRLDLIGVLGRVTVRVERTVAGVALPVSSASELGDPRPGMLAPTRPLAETSDRYALIVMRGALDDERRQILQGLGVRLHDVLGPSAYVAYVPPDARDAVRSRAFVDIVASLRPEFRYPPALARAAAETAEAPLDLLLLAYPEVDAAAVAAAIASSGAAILAWTTSEWQHSFHVRVPAAAVDRLAQIDGVKWIQGWPAHRIDNDIARNVIGAPAAWSAGFTGAGQTVAVADTGLDTGNQATLSADFRGKVAGTISYGSGWGDPNGHGTHTSGTVLGSGANSGGQLRGIAPGANLVVQAFGSDSSGHLFGVPADLNVLFRDSFAAGARVASNSWGSADNIYSADAQQIDQFVWNNPEMLIVFAAGNNGADAGADGVIDPGSLGTQGNMKNGIAVGASESLRTSGNTKTYAQWGTELGRDWSSEPIASDHISDNAVGLAAFSSRGPSRDGRVKPDIIAPGTNVLSARSHHPSATSPKYPYNDDYQFLSGTSMATPVVAGAAAVVREFLAKAKGTPNPSAALVKAILLNGATAVEPGQYGPERGAAVFGDDFEAASAAWIADQPWKRTGEDRHSGAWSWKYAGGSTAALTLQQGISLVGVSKPVLRFWHRYELSSGDAGPRLCFPLNLAFGLASKLFGAEITSATTSGSARVQASADGGVSWQTVASFNGRSGWAQDRADLSAFAGRPDVRLRFQASSPSLAEAAEWQIDDLEVGSFAPTEIPRRPNWVEGFGRLNLAGAVGPVSFQDVKDGLQTGAMRSYTLTATQSGSPLSVMLVWTDYPGSPQAKRPLVNDLDLAVIDPTGRRSYPNGLAAPDRVNNVEQVTIAAAQAGTYRVDVTAASVPMGPQPFALVVHGGQLGSAAQTPGSTAPPQTPTTTAYGYLVPVSDYNPPAGGAVTIVAQLTNAGRSAMEAGRIVTWSVRGNGGTLSTPTSITDGQGAARVTFTTGPAPGTTYAVTATDDRGVVGTTPDFVTRGATPGASPSPIATPAPSLQVLGYFVPVSDYNPQPGAAVIVTAQLTSNGRALPEAGHTLSWVASGVGGYFQTPTSATDAAGSSRVTFVTGPTPGTGYTITVTDERGITGSSPVVTAKSTPGQTASPPPLPVPIPPPKPQCASSVGPGIPPPQGLLTGIDGLHAAWYGQSGYPTLCPGQRATATVAFLNTGTIGWVLGRPGETAYLGTWGPEPGQDKPSPLGGDGTAGSPNTGWPAYNRVAVQPASYVGPGQVVWFQFVIQAPATPGTYRLALRPLIEGTQWLEDYGVFWYVTVKSATAP